MKRGFGRQDIQSYFEHHLGKLKPNQNGQAMARCVFHHDHRPSLSINLETGQWKCFACNSGGGIIQFQMRVGKCDRATARRELRTWLTVKTSGGEATRRKIVETYDYTDETGVLLKQVVRFSPKDFSQRKPDGKGGWIWNVQDVRNLPYRLSEVLRAQTVFIVEGEKDVESLRARGLVATTNAHGAGNWPDDFGKYLAGKETIILPDNDPSGQDHVQKVARNLHSFATSVKLLELPGLAPKGDVTDWFCAGNTAEKLLDLVSSCPLWKPTQEAAPSARAQGNHPLQSASQIRSKPECLTELGNSERLVRRHGIDLRYCHTDGQWRIWGQTHWMVDVNGKVVELAKDTVRNITTEISSETDGDERWKIDRWAKRSESAHSLNAMIKLAQSDPSVSAHAHQFDENPMLLNVPNGTIDLRTGALQPHNRTDLISKIASVGYDINAPCARWMAFLEEITAGRAALSSFLQRIAGYALTGENNEQVLFLLLGSGANGKSTFLETLKAMMGDYAATADFSTLLQGPEGRPRNDLARLVGKRLVTAVEVGRGQKLAEVVTKTITGSDTITVRHLFCEGFEYKPQFKLFLAANHSPIVQADDDAMWRRILIVPFDASIPASRQDKNLSHQLHAELPGILAWAVQGRLAFQRDGLNPPTEVKLATSACRENQHSIYGFVKSQCDLDRAAFTFSAELKLAYESFCSNRGLLCETENAFGRYLRRLGLSNGRRGADSLTAWIGIRLKVVLR